MPYKNHKDGLARGKRYYHTHRKERIANAKAWVEKNRELVRERRRIRTKKEKWANQEKRLISHGWSHTKVAEALVLQKGLCAICKEPMGKLGPRADHNHTTSKPRALLCHLCNTFIGSARESIDILQSAIDYLRKYNLRDYDDNPE